MKLRTYLLGGSILAMPLFVATAQAAQTAAGSEEAIGEIVVTAQRREENIQKVPLTIQALTSDTIEQKQVVGMDDYIKLVPSVTITSLGPGRANVYFRGIATGAGDPTSAMYLDETPIAAGLDVHIYDVSRVEALSGPQGTLFGASAEAGVVRIITNKPDTTKFYGGLDIQANKFGPGAPGAMFEGFTNIPITENAAVRVVGFYNKTGGYIDNTPATVTFQLGDNDPNTKVVDSNKDFVEKDANWNEQYGARIEGMLKLNDDWTINTQLMYQTTDSRGNALFVPKDGDLQVHEWSKPFNRNKWLLAALSVEGKIGMFDLIYSGSYLARQTSTANDYTYYSLYYDSTPGYTNFPLADGTFLDPLQHYFNPAHQKRATQELRISTPQENPWRLTAGGFFQTQPTRSKGQYYNPGFHTIVNVATHVPRPVIDDALYVTYSHNQSTDTAGFVEGSYEITDQLTLTAGIRYFQYWKHNVATNGIFRSMVKAGCVLPLTAATIDSCITGNNTVKGSGETHKVNLQYQVTPDKMVYFTYSTGYRPGGFNTNPAIRPYTSDTLDNFELGYKTTWNNVLRLNGAFYYEKWNGMQFSVVVPGNNGQRGTYNAGQATVKGAELDATYLVTDALTLSGNLAYNDGKLSRNLCNLAPDLNLLQTCTTAAQIVSAKGTRLPFQPKLKMSLTARYETDVGNDWTGYVQGSFNHQSNSTNDIRAFAAAIFGPNPAFSTVDFSIGGKHDDVGVEFFIQNAFDKRGIISKSAFCAIEICPNTVLNLPIKPQFFGVKISDKF